MTASAIRQSNWWTGASICSPSGVPLSWTMALTPSSCLVESLRNHFFLVLFVCLFAWGHISGAQDFVLREHS